MPVERETSQQPLHSCTSSESRTALRHSRNTFLPHKLASLLFLAWVIHILAKALAVRASLRPCESVRDTGFKPMLLLFAEKLFQCCSPQICTVANVGALSLHAADCPQPQDPQDPRHFKREAQGSRRSSRASSVRIRMLGPVWQRDILGLWTLSAWLKP